MRRLLATIFTGWDSVFDVIPTVVIVAIIYWFSRRKKHKKLFGEDFKEVRKKARLNEIIRLLFVCYITGLACMTLFPVYLWGAIINLDINYLFSSHYSSWHFSYIPEIWTFITDRNLLPMKLWLKDFLGMALNVVLFVPLGFALPFVWKKASFLITALIGLAGTVFIELVVQPFISRDPTIDDIICNTLGTVIGYLLYLLIKKIFPRFTEKCKTSVLDANKKSLA